mmetsp:Transcript_11139/g.31507  ORF Transcript_11139/g.31507 Transcript_11139/m.31507 type:complete len:247 (-) Transcript_11139:1082-1822(-)
MPGENRVILGNSFWSQFCIAGASVTTYIKLSSGFLICASRSRESFGSEYPRRNNLSYSFSGVMLASKRFFINSTASEGFKIRSFSPGRPLYVVVRNRMCHFCNSTDEHVSLKKVSSMHSDIRDISSGKQSLSSAYPVLARKPTNRFANATSERSKRFQAGRTIFGCNSKFIAHVRQFSNEPKLFACVHPNFFSAVSINASLNSLVKTTSGLSSFCSNMYSLLLSIGIPPPEPLDESQRITFLVLNA